MSNFVIKGLVAATLAAITSAGFTAQEAKTLSVTATIQGGCALTMPSTMSFGNLNMASSNDETQSVDVNFRCATGTTVTSFSVGGSSSGTFNGTLVGAATSDTINYTINWDLPSLPYTGTGFGAAGVNVKLNGNIPNANYKSKQPDNYAQNVVVAINF